MKSLIIPYAEIMITQVCNLSCKGCSTYSDLPHKGYTTWNKGLQEIEPWLDRVEFDHFGLMGGEPLVNPQIREWLIGIRKLMPNTTIRVPINGTLLHNHFDIVDLLNDLGNVIFKITVHTQDQVINDAIEFVMNRFKWKPVHEFGIHRWETGNNFKFQINHPTKFFMTFKNDYTDAEPYKSDPIRAFDVCHQKLCPLLHNGRIYKCSTSGLMGDILKNFDYPHYEDWKPYWDNSKNGSISPESTDSQILSFINNVSKPHWICKQCPTRDTITEIVHLENVSWKK